MLETKWNVLAGCAVAACAVGLSAGGSVGCSGTSDGQGLGGESGSGSSGDDASSTTSGKSGSADDDAASSGAGNDASGSGSNSGSTSGSTSGSSSGSAHDAGGTSGKPTGGTDAGATKDASTTGTGDASSAFDQFQQHNLDVVNMYRAMVGSAPLTLDAKLNAFALAGSQELTQDHMPHQHFMTVAATMNGSGLFTGGYGFNMNAGENQGDPDGWTVLVKNDAVANELAQIDAIQLAMWNEGPGTGEAHGHYENIINVKFKRMGAGLVEVANMLYLTNDFSD
ncbi:MAG TPA: CAP domain-containing protein [Polyangiaceae bacterium]|jgi:uncharacterized protein YkwD|nr:CAP domain-containing protein [Polyangiaceae bacterium]